MTHEAPSASSAKWYQRRAVQFVAGGLIVLLVGVGIGSAGHASGKTKTVAGPTVTATATTTQPVPGETATVRVTVPVTVPVRVTTTYTPVPAVAFAGDGTFLVGKEVVPGTYEAAASPGCYWEVDGSNPGSISNIIANDNADGQAVITIPATAFSVTTRGCSDFHHA